eukprot:6207231-Pleurochrysis_carterae.AAC.2
MSTAEASPQLQLYSDRGDYDRASDECMCGDGSCVNNNRPITPKSARLHREDRGKEPSGSPCRHALRGINSTRERTAQTCINANAKTCKCACKPINLGMYNLTLTYVAMAVSVDRTPAEV